MEYRPLIAWCVEMRAQRVLSFRIAPLDAATENAALALYDAIMARRHPQPRVPTGLIWHLPKRIITTVPLSQHCVAACMRGGIPVEEATADIPFLEHIRETWERGVAGRTLRAGHCAGLLDAYLRRAHGYGPLREFEQRAHLYASLVGYGQDPAWQFPLLREFLPVAASSINADGAVPYCGFHYTHELLSYWPGRLVTIRRSPSTDATAWIYLDGEILCQAHSLSTIGSNGSNRLLPRRQLLADKTETDACGGNIAKHHHAALVAQYFAADGSPLCPACRAGDGRRAAALLDQADYQALSFERIVRECALCDTHGFLVTAKNAESETGTAARQKISKTTLIDFTYALALPDRHAKTEQLHTRAGTSKEEGQMIMKIPARSGEYALCIRYTCAGIGADTERWLLFVKDQALRVKRHRAVLRALRDSLVSLDGALVATMLPHLTGLKGALMVRTNVGRAPLYSALESDFVMRLGGMIDETCTLYPFETIDAFYTLMNHFIATSVPEFHPYWRTEVSGQ